jgi:hypothetical protein
MRSGGIFRLTTETFVSLIAGAASCDAWGTHALPADDEPARRCVQEVRERPGWRPTSTVGAPAGRRWPAVAWTGREMVVWGHYTYQGEHFMGDGGLYDACADSWRLLPAPPAGLAHTQVKVVWTSSKLIFWGGYHDETIRAQPGRGAIYEPRRNRWFAVSEVGAPSDRANHAAVWTGKELMYPFTGWTMPAAAREPGGRAGQPRRPG